MKISKFEPSSVDEIITLFTQVFSDSEGELEGKVIGQLVTDLFAEVEDLIAYVAVNKEEIIACICFSKLLLSSCESAFLLSPAAVATREQGKGLGQELIKYGINRLKLSGIDFVFTYGDPNFYSRVGFEQINEDFVNAPFRLSYPHGWLAQALNGKDLVSLKCSTQCVNALNKKEYW